MGALPNVIGASVPLAGGPSRMQLSSILLLSLLLLATTLLSASASPLPLSEHVHQPLARTKRSPTIGLNIANLLRIAAFPFVFLPTNFIGLQVTLPRPKFPGQSK